MDNIIIGNGLVAKSIAPLDFLLNETCIFASGVSNSTCNSADEFERERCLLQTTIDGLAGRKIVYFSTCSIYDNFLNKKSQYVIHKLKMEELVRLCNNFLIIRLPLLIGFTRNPHTLANFLFYKITHGETFEVYNSAFRNILDVNHAALISVNAINNLNLKNDTINIANPKSIHILELIRIMESVLCKSAYYKLIDGGSRIDIFENYTDCVSDLFDIIFDCNYEMRIIEKYYGGLNL